METIDKIKEEVSNQISHLRADQTTWIDSGTYVSHVDFLLQELAKAQQQADQWELNYYRKEKELQQ